MVSGLQQQQCPTKVLPGRLRLKRLCLANTAAAVVGGGRWGRAAMRCISACPPGTLPRSYDSPAALQDALLHIAIDCPLGSCRLADTAPNCDVTVLAQTLEPFDCKQSARAAWLGASMHTGSWAPLTQRRPRGATLPPATKQLSAPHGWPRLPTVPLWPLPADGIAFHANSSDALVDEWSSAVLRLQVRGMQWAAARRASVCLGVRSFVRSFGRTLPLNRGLYSTNTLHTPCCVPNPTQEAGTLNELYNSWITSPGSGCQTTSQVRRASPDWQCWAGVQGCFHCPRGNYTPFQTTGAPPHPQTASA